jgi:hypothetical protein
MQKNNSFSMNVISKYSNIFYFIFSFVDEIKKCMEPLEMCKQPRHVQRLGEYIDEIKSDVCTQEIVSKIQETKNVDTLDVNSLSYKY